MCGEQKGNGTDVEFVPGLFKVFLFKVIEN